MGSKREHEEKQLKTTKSEENIKDGQILPIKGKYTGGVQTEGGGPMKMGLFVLWPFFPGLRVIFRQI